MEQIRVLYSKTERAKISKINKKREILEHNLELFAYEEIGMPERKYNGIRYVLGEMRMFPDAFKEEINAYFKLLKRFEDRVIIPAGMARAAMGSLEVTCG